MPQDPSRTAIRARYYWFPLISWLLVIFLFSTDSFSSDQTSRIIVPILKFLLPWLSRLQLDFWHHVIRKASHVSEYFVLGILVYRTVRMERSNSFKVMLLAFAFVLIAAASDEFHQSFTVSRGASVIDIGYDCLGGIIALCFLAFLSRLRNEHRDLHSHSVL